ncbi:MAG: 1-deoxy-D-xylulose-5-phosphate synthase [Candidatus Omnitrophica bacterium]|nr:1-deoxy-D-xylulose-5-phosphate synthase [Candidatus Omnitrophota bacterium]
MRLLETIDSPDDLKRLPVRQLPQLAAEIREEILQVVSALGGHLASSLGAVELCIALHYVFETPHDQLVWDMGYQAYAHKLLTGRRDRFRTLKQLKGLSGFCNKDESPYDLFSVGHGGTCLSTAMGLAMAGARARSARHVGAIIGDASLGEGMALEALNHIGHVKPNLLVTLNDNKMSIAPPVGGLSRYLNRVITNPLYNRIRLDLEAKVAKLPKGPRLVQLGHKIEESLKGFLVPGLLFEELGFRYVGPIDGHNLPELIATLRNVKRLKGPILLHLMTVKGKGYRPAEQDPERFHKIDPFDLKTGQPKTVGRLKEKGRQISKSATGITATFTEAFSEALLELAERDERILAITAAMPEGTGLSGMAKRFPERYIDVGMAEQHALGLAAGLARGGLRPVVAIYATFLQRAFDQVVHELCLQNLPVVLAIDRASLVGEDGPTHHGVFDLAYLRQLPNLTVVSPKDPDELKGLLRWACGMPGPVAIRYARGGISGEPVGRCARIIPGKAELLQPGRDLTIMALGSLVYEALRAAALLRQEGIEAGVVNARFVKPIDEMMIRQCASQTGVLVSVEEAQLAGGFGSAVSEALERLGLGSVPLHRLGLPDQFIEHGQRSQLLKLCRLDADSLARRISHWYQTIRVAREADSILTASPE